MNRTDLKRVYYDEVLTITIQCPHCSERHELRERAQSFRPMPQPLPQYSGWRLVGLVTVCVVVAVVAGVVMLSVVIDNL